MSSGGYVPTQDIIDEFGKNPGNRKAVAIKTYDGTTVLGKYINRGDEYHQLYIIRLAEMYLISAEGLGYDKGGLDRLNELRAKRGLVNKSITDEDTMLKAAVYERRLEFIGEGFRWFDLSRTGKTPDNLEDKYSILPIPTRELDLNPLLKQNTPWL